MFGSALLGIFFSAAYMPSPTKLLVQIVAGAMIGCSIERSDIKSLPLVLKPILIVILTFFALNMAAGVLISLISPIDLMTALMCVVPGGVTDTPIIATEMGADTPKVALAQLARYLLGVGAYPPMILAYDSICRRLENRRNARPAKTSVPPEPAGEGTGTKAEAPQERIKSKVKSPLAFVCTSIVALGAGLLGDISGVPAGTFLFAIIAVMTLRLCFDFAYIPLWVRKITLLVSGCYIGSGIGMDDVRGFSLLALPIFIILAGYIVNSFITGTILSRICGFSRKEGMLITTPAGAADIALSSADMGINNTAVIVIQVFRAIIAIVTFPQIINLIVR